MCGRIRTAGACLNPEPLYFTDSENELKRHLNSKVTVKGNENGKGLIQIPFRSHKILKDLIKKIKRED